MKKSLSPRSISKAFALVLFSGAITAQAAETVYTLDPTHTQVDFHWNHLGLSEPGASFDEVRGTLRVDDADPTRSSVEVVMPLSGVRTRVPGFDDDFRSPKFFDAAKYPNVTFKSTKVERAGIGNRYTVTGDLTAHGITKPAVLDVVLNGQGIHPMTKAPVLGFNATTVVKRSDYGLTIALPMVSDEIQVRITTEAHASK
ncbi:YceI family protein [Pseudomonas aeruginosa]|uniref:YceI family protein n=1 Tax=Pseudomonas aeruginosa TaxID=287 RepID=UPI0034D2AE7C